MKKSPYKNRGFTLIELLLVTGMMAVVGMVVYGAFASGISIWKRVADRPVTEDINLIFRNFSYDARNSFTMTGLKFQGAPDEVSFPTLIQGYDGGVGRNVIGYVTYDFDRRRKALYKTQMDYSGYFTKKKQRKSLLAEGISSIHLEYFVYDEKYKKFSWVTHWPEDDSGLGHEAKDTLPLMIRMEIGVPEGRKEKKFSWTIEVPAGCCWPMEDEQ